MIQEYLSDVTFTLAKGKEELKAHKFFLMTASPVFHTVFSSQTVDVGIPIEIKIDDISKATMTEICRFAYSELVNFTQHNMIDIMLAASKLQMKFLVEKCVNYIGKEGLNEHSVFKVLEANRKDKNMVINMKCFDYIQKQHKKCFKSTEFLQMSGDSMRLLLQTCKLPQTVTKEAIAMWTAHPDNSDEDIDELIALISLNDYPEEAVNHVPEHGSSDNESNISKSSRPDSRADSTRGGPRQRNRQQMNPQQAGRQQNLRGQFSNSQPNVNQMQGDGARKLKIFVRDPQNATRQPQYGTQQPQHNGQGQPPQAPIISSSPYNLFFAGRISRKSFKFANLDLVSYGTAVKIREVHFAYDLSSTDREFEIWICDVTDGRVDLFYSKSNTDEKFNGAYTRFVLPRPCEIEARKKIFIRVEFPRQEYRLSFDDFNITPTSTKDRLAIRRDTGFNSYAQIVKAIGFSDA